MKNRMPGINETNVAIITVKAEDEEDAEEQVRDLYYVQETLVSENISMVEGGVELEVERG